MKILVIEDDQGLRQGIAFSLTQEGYQVLQASSGKEGYRLFLQESPLGILLDLNLPDMDGNDLCRKIRETSQVPILMLTARDMETDEIMGLSQGADDYMTKPFSIAVLKLRLAKLLDRNMDKEEAHILRSGDIVLDQDLIKVWKENQEMECSVTEYRILKYFLENKNQVLTQNQILEAVWDLRRLYPFMYSCLSGGGTLLSKGTEKIFKSSSDL